MAKLVTKLKEDFTIEELRELRRLFNRREALTEREFSNSQVERELMQRREVGSGESIRCVAGFPMPPTGKPDMQRLKAMAMDLEQSRVAQEESPTAEELA